jgi:peptidylprolyl isomerase
MMTTRLSMAALSSLVLLSPAVTAQTKTPPGTTQQKPAAAGAEPAPGSPVLTIDTVKGPVVVELLAAEAPKSVAHIVELARKRFYDGQAVHRTVPGQLVQFGDQQSRDMTLKEWWGRGPKSGSGNPIGVAEISKKLKHRRGTVSLAHSGDPKGSDSQMFIALRPIPQWDGKYVIVGQVTSGMENAAKLQVGDRLKKVTVSAPAK